MAADMLSFVTNDNVVIRYLDTGSKDPEKREKDPLILVRTRRRTSSSSVIRIFCAVLMASYALLAVHFVPLLVLKFQVETSSE
jgi:hypothetical protein